MTTKIQKWGNSLAVRLPIEVRRKLNLTEGKEVHLTVEQGRIIVEPSIAPKKQKTIADWREYLIPSGKKHKENISENIDHILYGAPPR